MSGETMPPQRRYSKLEEALEVKSLRRILCAYLNYSDAAEEDVRRYERSFRKLSPEHKALLSHLPEKYQRLRRCISVNSFFIMCMLQAFDPPFDISQYVYPDELEDMENIPAVNLQAQASNCTEDCNNQAKHAPRESQINSSASQSSSNGVLCHGGPALQRITKKQRSSPPTDWMETSLRLNIPFVDIDKVC
ncbi:hypothetical protein AXF42_Ash009603 [Apostasia shenzhenica]|uniref:Uncharacterized protein n=1 Tax=Apostasia shenzhenica TaxID=1088818 RepID=A0A2I0B9F2_9ASPA|nr:hypothetical protein AXF42_Ash009603 [Apostasia shenzhenica]